MERRALYYSLDLLDEALGLEAWPQRGGERITCFWRPALAALFFLHIRILLRVTFVTF